MEVTTVTASADPVPVRRSQGSFHGFLLLKTEEGKTIANGDLVQVGHGDRLTAHITYHFRDGSIDDETTVYTQRKVFKLISDHHIQHGPSFPKSLDMQVDAASGDVTYKDENGRPAKEHFTPMADLCNGLPLVVLLNLDPAGPMVRLPMIAPAVKPRLVHLVIEAQGQDPLTIGGVRVNATNYRVHIDLGGVAGVVAPIIGKQPADIHVWIVDGAAPAFVRKEGQSYEGGPIWRVELAAPVFSQMP
jgi:hypothetical protein